MKPAKFLVDLNADCQMKSFSGIVPAGWPEYMGTNVPNSPHYITQITANGYLALPRDLVTLKANADNKSQQHPQQHRTFMSAVHLWYP